MFIILMVNKKEIPQNVPLPLSEFAANIRPTCFIVDMKQKYFLQKYTSKTFSGLILICYMLTNLHVHACTYARFHFSIGFALRFHAGNVLSSGVWTLSSR